MPTTAPKAVRNSRALTVGPYVLLERLGQGGMGTVFKARHTRLRRLAAVKVLSRFAHRGRFLREVQIAARLDHPNVVHAYDADLARDTSYLAMEYVDGTDLSRLVRRDGPLSIGLACEYTRQAALALQ